MKSYAEALSIILDNVQVLPKTRVRLDQLHGMVLGEPVVANYDLPHFDNSAVDGYGVCLADVLNVTQAQGAELALKGEVRAGDPPPAVLPSGSSYRIFTGAPVPEGVDAVVMQEYCREHNGNVEINRRPNSGENIRRRGEEFLRGQEILPAGITISPPVVGLLASIGQASFMVHKKPVVGVVSTGSELIKPGKNLTAGKIYDSNSPALLAALQDLGVNECHPFHCREDFDETRKVLSLAMSVSDVVITAGGVSVGDHDYVKKALEDLGVKTMLYKIAVKPGKPVYFGIFANPRRKGKRQYIFGLPGNPVSSLVSFHEFVKPALLKLMGCDQDPAVHGVFVVEARLSRALKKARGRTELVRARVRVANGGYIAEPVTGQDSHMLGGLCQANALIVFPEDKEHLDADELVEAKFLQWRG